MQLPNYLMGQVNGFGDGIDSLTNALYRYQDQQNRARQMGMEQERLGLERSRFGLQERDSNRLYQEAQDQKAAYTALMANPEPWMTRSPETMAAVKIGGYSAAPNLIMQGRNADLQRQQLAQQGELARAQIAQIRNQTPQARAAMAGQYGIDPNTPEGKAFILNGTYTPPSNQLVHMKPGETAAVFDSKSGSLRQLPGQAEATQAQFDSKYAQDQAPKNFDESGKAFREAQATVGTTEDLLRLSQYASTGWGADSILALRKAASRFGIANPETIAPTELFRALTQKYVLSEGQKLKPMSNTDVQFVEKGLATIYSDPSSLPIMLPALRHEAMRTARAQQLMMESYGRGRPPNMVAIEQQVDREMPSIIRQIFSQPNAPAEQPTTPNAQPQQGAPGRQPQAPAPIPAGTYEYTPNGLRPVNNAPPETQPQSGGPQQPMTPAERAQARRAAVMEQRNTQAAAQTQAVSQSFDSDRATMDPLSFAQKYDGSRRLLSPQQNQVLNALIQQLERSGG